MGKVVLKPWIHFYVEKFLPHLLDDKLDVMVSNEYKGEPPVHTDLAKVVQGGETVRHLVKRGRL